MREHKHKRRNHRKNQATRGGVCVLARISPTKKGFVIDIYEPLNQADIDKILTKAHGLMCCSQENIFLIHVGKDALTTNHPKAFYQELFPESRYDFFFYDEEFAENVGISV